jgi:hypothetical protein
LERRRRFHGCAPWRPFARQSPRADWSLGHRASRTTSTSLSHHPLHRPEDASTPT